MTHITDQQRSEVAKKLLKEIREATEGLIETVLHTEGIEE